MRRVHSDVAVVGAGPGGLSAAVHAADQGARVCLVDSGPRLGGQYWRHSPFASAQLEQPDAQPSRWHHGWGEFRTLYARMRRHEREGTIRVLSRHHVHGIDPPMQAQEGGFTLHAYVPAEFAQPEQEGGRACEVHTSSVILAPGTYDTLMPVPGWDLPGVMAAGGIQALIKTHEALALGHSRPPRVLLAGTGPFLVACASSVINAGGEVVAIVEASRASAWFPRGILAAGVPSKLREGAQYARELLRHRVPVVPSHMVTRIEATEQAHTERPHAGLRPLTVHVSALTAAGALRTDSTRVFSNIDVVGLGWGFTPHMELPLQLGCAVARGADGSLVARADDRLESSVPGVFVVGEVTGVKGAAGAVADGAIAGRASVGAAVRRRDRMTRARHRLFAQAMHAAHPIPAAWMQALSDDTIVCRCEEVDAAAVRHACRTLEPATVRTVKGLTRASMGMCQGRMCVRALQGLCETEGANAEAAAPAAMAESARRPLATPVELGSLAGLE